jgi:hypothetical protein
MVNVTGAVAGAKRHLDGRVAQTEPLECKSFVALMAFTRWLLKAQFTVAPPQHRLSFLPEPQVRESFRSGGVRISIWLEILCHEDFIVIASVLL